MAGDGQGAIGLNIHKARLEDYARDRDQVWVSDFMCNELLLLEYTLLRSLC